MMPVLLIMATVWQQGHWIGGQPADIVFTRAQGITATDADIAWELKYGQIVLQRGQLKFPADAKSARLQMIPPTPQQRQSFALTFDWIAKAADNGQTLAQSSQTIHVYPANVLEAPTKHFAARSVMTVGRATELTDVLTAAGVKATRVEQVSQLVGREPDLVVVEPDGLPREPMLQQPLVDLMHRGATVVVLRQYQAKSVLGHQMVDRAPSKLIWRTDHLLLATLEEADWQSMMAQMPDAATWRCVRIGADQPADVLACLSPDGAKESAGQSPVDALLVVQKVGEGRLVISQLPTGSWKTDPRSCVLLANVLELAVAPVEPTPSKIEREKIKDKQAAQRSN